MLLPALILALAPVGALARDADDPPAIFSTITLADALARSRADHTVVIADFTAEWCVPCKLMERTVWTQPGVAKWFADRRAVAVRIDADRNPALRTEYAVSAWPTHIGFKDGVLIDRRLGSMSSDQFVTWLETVDRGGTPPGQTTTIVRPAPPTPATPPTFGDQLEAARAARESGRNDKALADLMRLWSVTVEREAWRSSLDRTTLTEELQFLAATHPPARPAIAQERDRLEAVLKSDQRTFNALDGWLRLNDAIRDDARTLAWYDRIRNDPDSAATLDRTITLLYPILVRADRWSDAVRLTGDPIAGIAPIYHVLRKGSLAKYLDEPTRLAQREKLLDSARDQAAGTYAGLLGLGRDADAAALAAHAVTLDDTPALRLALVRKAIALKQPRQAQTTLLDQAAASARHPPADLDALRKTVASAPK